VAAPTLPVSRDFSTDLDHLLFQVCEELQITPARYNLAVSRYERLNEVLEGGDSPFRYLRPKIYPQGSMALGTTVAPVDGPHDLDFVLQISRDYNAQDPMALIQSLYSFLRQNAIYRPMTTIKRRCVRIEYADDFYMDVLPACHDTTVGGTCIKVPDRALKGWSDSNPKGYIDWFKKRSRMLFVRTMMDKAEPIPDQEAVAEKEVLQLIVQLTKRWRDIHFAGMDPKLAPISVVLTTLAAGTYRGERSVSRALASMLGGVVQLIDQSGRAGERHLHLHNPSNLAEDLTERWDSNPPAYQAFERGIRDFQQRWSRLAGQGNVKGELVALFGETVTTAVKKDAVRSQGARLRGDLGVTPSGRITSLAAASTPIRRNTFFGAE
jgi:hypothetical protein